MPPKELQAALLAGTILAYLLSFGAAVAEAASRNKDKPSPPRLRRALLAGAFVLHAALLGARDHSLKDAAFTTAGGVLLYVPWCLVFVAGIIDLRQDLKSLPIFLVPPVVASLILAALSLRDPAGPSTKIPEQGGVAIKLHVVAIVLSFSAFGFAAVLSAMYLFLEGQLKTKRFDSWLDLPALDRLERIGGRFLVTAFALLLVSVGLGAGVHALNGTLGPSWFLSPAILGCFVILAASGTVVFLRMRALLLGRRQAQATLAVFALVLGTLAAPLVTGGDHAPVPQQKD